MKLINFKYYISVLILVFTTVSCRKVIDLKLGNNTGELVIEGNVTNVSGPQYVKLSRNVPFTNTNVYPTVTGALVIVDDDKGNHFQLTEGPTGIYSFPFKGQIGSIYTLNVVTSNQSYLANSTMPPVVQLDSISSRTSEFSSGNKNQQVITVYFKDTPNVPNQYRFIMYVNSVQVKAIFAFDDEFIDGKYVNLDLQENDIDIYRKDTVKVEMQCLDRPIYSYWFTQEQQQADNPGGAVAPANPPTNITPTTLGYFSAHTTQTTTLVIK